MSDRPEDKKPAGESTEDQVADMGDAEDAEEGEFSGVAIPAEVLTSVRDAFARALQPQISEMARQIRVQLPPMQLPRVDIAPVNLPNLDAYVARVVRAAMPNVASMTAQLSFEIPNLRDVREQMQLLADMLPPNWQGSGINPVEAWPVLQEEGIPLVWVPRAEILAELIAAPDRAARLKILVACDSELADDCRAVLTEVMHSELAEQVPLGLKAIDAFAAGHHEAAQALAVVVVETVVTRLIEPKEQVRGERKSKYQRIVEALKVDDPKDLTVGNMRFRAAMAPIGPFFVPWHPDKGDPVPEELSRHVTVHQAHVAHYTPGHAAVAVMMVASVLRGIQEQLESPDNQ